MPHISHPRLSGAQHYLAPRTRVTLYMSRFAFTNSSTTGVCSSPESTDMPTQLSFPHSTPHVRVQVRAHMQAHTFSVQQVGKLSCGARQT